MEQSVDQNPKPERGEEGERGIRHRRQEARERQLALNNRNVSIKSAHDVVPLR